MGKTEESPDYGSCDVLNPTIIHFSFQYCAPCKKKKTMVQGGIAIISYTSVCAACVWFCLLNLWLTFLRVISLVCTLGKGQGHTSPPYSHAITKHSCHVMRRNIIRTPTLLQLRAQPEDLSGSPAVHSNQELLLVHYSVLIVGHLHRFL